MKRSIISSSCIVCLALWFISLTGSFAQGLQTLKFKHYSIEQGLSQITVNDILQDQKGYIWVATQDGLNRFDGYSFKVFKNNPADSTTVANSYISTLYQDRQDRMWVGTAGGGLSLYNSQTESFRNFSYSDTNPKSLNNNFVTSIYQDRKNRIWVGTDAGLNLLQEDGNGFEHFENEQTNEHSLSDNRVLTLYEDRSGKLWIGTLGGLNRFEEERHAFTRFVHDPANAKSIRHNEVRKILEDKQHRLWIGTRGGGLNLFDRQTGEFTHFLSSKDPFSISDNDVFDFIEDQHGNLWICTANGLCILDTKSKKITRFYHSPADPTSLSNNDVRKIVSDNSGNFWIGTAGEGVNYLDQNTSAFSHYSHKQDSKGSLSDNRVWGIYQDDKDRIWIGTHNGLNLLEPGSDFFVHFYNDPNNKQSLSHSRIYTIDQDNKGRVWIGTNNGANLFNEREHTFQHFFTDNQDAFAPSFNRVYKVFQDSNDLFWIATREGGLIRFDLDLQSIKQFSHIEGDTQSISHNRINHIFQDRQNRLWIATEDGLCLYRPHDEKFTCYRNSPDNKNSINGNSVNLTYQDSQGRLWVATGKGLNLLDPELNTFKSWDESKGLSNELIVGVLEDNNHNLWLSTIRGLNKFNPETETFKWYDKEDGLQDTEFNQFSFMKDHNGYMYFGGSNGVSFFHPDSIKENSQMPPVVITGFQLFNKPVAIGSSSVLKQSLEYTDEIVLTYKQNVFAFEFSALNYRQPKKNQFAYKLEPFNTDWIYTTSADRKAVFTNIPPGQYVFRVKASNNDGYWNEEGTSIYVTILPPWWLTWWAKTIWITLFFGSFFTFYKVRTSTLKVQKRKLLVQVEERTKELKNANEELNTTLEKLQESHDEITRKNGHLTDLNREKDGIMDVVAHDLRSPLNNIEGLVTILPLEGPLTNEQQQHIERIKNQVYSGKNLINDLLDIHAYGHEGTQLNLTEVSLDLYLSEIISSYNALLEKKSQNIVLDFKSQQAVIVTDKSILRRILDNLLTNAMKFSRMGTTITLACWQQNGFVKISVADQGPGISEDDQKKMFKMFQKLSARPTGGESSNGLGLSIIKTLTEKLKGTIEVKSTLGKGTEFTISLPS